MGCGSAKQVQVADINQLELDYDVQREDGIAATTKYNGLKVGQKLLYLDEINVWIVGEVIKILYEGASCNVLLHFLSRDEIWIEVASNITKLAPLELLNSYAIDNGIPLSMEQLQNVQYYLEKGTLKRGISTVVSVGIVHKTEFEKEANSEEGTYISQPAEFNQSVSYFKQLMRDDSSCANSATYHSALEVYVSSSPAKKTFDEEFPVLSKATSFSPKTVPSANDSCSTSPLRPSVVQPTYATVARGVLNRPTGESIRPRKVSPPFPMPNATPLSPFTIAEPRSERVKVIPAPSVETSYKEEMIGKAVVMRGYLKSRKLHLTKQEVDALNAIIHFHDKAKNHQKDFPPWVYNTYEKVLAKYDEVLSSHH
jgi:hypothetical protein